MLLILSLFSITEHTNMMLDEREARAASLLVLLYEA